MTDLRRLAIYATTWVATLGLVMQSAAAQSKVALSPASVSPTKTMQVSGSGHGYSVAVDAYVDTTDTLLLVS